MNDELKKIKKLYGEKMAHLCRELFPTLLETEGIVLKLLLQKFDVSRFLAEDIISERKEAEFKNYIYSFVNVEGLELEIVDLSPKELLDQAGYILYECKTEEEIQSFKKYYAPGEALCTFNGNRLIDYHVFFAVKKNVDEIRREDFDAPTRQDLYGTSVISLQFFRGEVNYLSIKNRYNHKVNNPDATFSNNLENIIPGLTESFNREYQFNLSKEMSRFELDNYIRASDGKFYKYNMEINNIYYCSKNRIIMHNEVKELDKNRYLLCDNFVIDLKSNKIDTYETFTKIRSSYMKDDGLSAALGGISNISVSNDGGIKVISIECEVGKVVLKVDVQDRIVSFDAPDLEFVGDFFLASNKALQEFSVPSLKVAGDCLLYDNEALTKFVVPLLTEVGSDCLTFNTNVSEVYAPFLEKVGENFLYNNLRLKELSLPSLKRAADYFLSMNKCLEKVYFPNLENEENIR